MALSKFELTSTVTIAWPSTWSEVVNGPAAGAVATPAVPASTVAVQNISAFPVQVVITAGTITAVVVNGVTVGTAAGTYVVPAAGTISITYSVAPTWAWSAATGGPSAGLAESALVADVAPAGGQAGPIPQSTFIKGTVIMADSTAGNSGPQQLYAALGGAANLKAFTAAQESGGIDGVSN